VIEFCGEKTNGRNGYGKRKNINSEDGRITQNAAIARKNRLGDGRK
jgi:hypothetical protein